MASPGIAAALPKAIGAPAESTSWIFVKRSSGFSENQRLNAVGSVVRRALSAGVLLTRRACARRSAGVPSTASAVSIIGAKRRIDLTTEICHGGSPAAIGKRAIHSRHASTSRPRGTQYVRAQAARVVSEQCAQSAVATDARRISRPRLGADVATDAGLESDRVLRRVSRAFSDARAHRGSKAARRDGGVGGTRVLSAGPQP